jgi:hypothetical protein
MVILVLGLVGCAKDVVRARYPATPDEPTGTLVLKLSRPASEINVAINGLLVVNDAHTAQVIIENVPTGTREVVIAANGSDKAFTVWVGSDHPTTVPLGVPEAGMGFVKSLAGSLLSIAVSTLLRS